MNRLKLLIADGTEEFRCALADALRGAYQIRMCSEGNQAQSLLQSFQPDILVLDLMLPGLDGISLLHWAVDAGLRPIVLAVSRFITDYMVEEAGQFGVGYMMLKPCDVHATAARIGDLSARIHPPQMPVADIRTQVSNLLLALGIPAKLNGYGYLREALVLKARDPSQMLTKQLYPDVARMFGCEATHVERSIRGAIDSAWKKRDEHLWRIYFPPDGQGMIRRPTNGAFISRMAEGLKPDPETEK